MNKKLLLLFLCAIASSMPALGMCGRFSNYLTTKFASSVTAVNKLCARSAAHVSQFKNKFTQARIPIKTNRANLCSFVYGSGMFASIAKWFQTTKQRQERECAAEQKIIMSHKPVNSVVIDMPQEQTYTTPWQAVRNQHYQDLQAKQSGEVSKKYLHILKQRENELEAELFDRLKLTHESWQQFKKDQHAQFLADTHCEINRLKAQSADNFDARIMSAFKNACQRMGVDGNNINLIDVPASTPSTMYVTQHHLMVNQTLCLMPYFSDDQKREVSIARELQHILHDDTFDKYCIEKIQKLHSDKVSQEWCQTFTKKVSHFKEERADIMVTLADPMYGQIGKDTFKDLSNPSWILQKIATSLGKDLKDPSPMTHPSSLYRYECVNKVHQDVVNALENNKKGNNG